MGRCAPTCASALATTPPRCSTCCDFGRPTTRCTRHDATSGQQTTSSTAQSERFAFSEQVPPPSLLAHFSPLRCTFPLCVLRLTTRAAL
eukprot:1513776-Pleurochrysis_carterae.AAC.1